MPMLPSSRTICPAVRRRSSGGAIAQSSMSMDNHTVPMSATLGPCRNIGADGLSSYTEVGGGLEPQQTAGSSCRPSFEWWIICGSLVC
ncbi:hypothetical protein OH76DRAFT_1552494 [Lentinus brumalis]|uniref:Uncharacterized protein n=1 Tax=Lentinus brumalis TaxID=2498619 RepID=A0A371DPI0_9APHY|nr:hypothetical protein OH76DRAFT_1552494 [Polyporus brumalis]